jgi:hypothetical protein
MFILMERVDYEGSSLIGAYATLEAAIDASRVDASSFESKSLSDYWRQPAGTTALWSSRKPGHDVTFLIWAVAV